MNLGLGDNEEQLKPHMRDDTKFKFKNLKRFAAKQIGFHSRNICLLEQTQNKKKVGTFPEIHLWSKSLDRTNDT